MALTQAFKQTVRARVQRDRNFFGMVSALQKTRVKLRVTAPEL
jgi:hypothetical protein